MPCTWQVLLFSVQNNRNLSQEDDSLDAEDLFDLEGMDSRENMNSDQDDYDSDGKFVNIHHRPISLLLDTGLPTRATERATGANVAGVYKSN